MIAETPAMGPQDRSNSRTTDGKNICLQTYATRENRT
jgi:hypothetical protein